jgi:hypothetical protein
LQARMISFGSISFRFPLLTTAAMSDSSFDNFSPFCSESCPSVPIFDRYIVISSSCTRSHANLTNDIFLYPHTMINARFISFRHGALS